MANKVAMLLSGGVDSSVSMRLLQEQGYDVTAFYIKIWLEDELAYLGNCPWQEDLDYARRVCDQANVPLKVVSLQKEYWNEVVSHSIAEIKAGRTPNPDILCNERIKFGVFINNIGKEFDYIATGHYAQIKRENEDIFLHCSQDSVKDQTYFLSHVKKEDLSRVLFPIGHLNKTQVRQLAKKYDLPNKDRKDSQGICFLGKLQFNEFVRYHLGDKKGDLVEFETGNKVGDHNGYWYYTVGQRQGLGIAGGPWYVVSKDIEKNIVFVSRSYYTSDKARDKLVITNCNWLIQPNTDKELLIKLRHGPNFNSCKINKVSDDSFEIKLSQRDQGIAKGQYAALYDGKVCLGSGIITKSL